jgi:hypothetical protein
VYYRHVTQAERWLTTEAQSTGRLWRAAIPADYTATPYALQYYFEVAETPASAALYPGLGGQLTSQPYFVVRKG